MIVRQLLELRVGTHAARARQARVARRRIVQAAEELHAYEGEDDDHERHEHEQVGDLRDCGPKCDDDLVQPAPAAHQLQHAHHPQHPQHAHERELGHVSAVTEDNEIVRQQHVNDRLDHNQPIENIPVVRPVAVAAEPADFERHLEHKEPCDGRAGELERLGVARRHALVRQAHDEHIDEDEARREAGECARGGQGLE